MSNICSTRRGRAPSGGACILCGKSRILEGGARIFGGELDGVDGDGRTRVLSGGARIFCDKSRILQSAAGILAGEPDRAPSCDSGSDGGSDSVGSDLDYSDARSSRSGSIIGGDGGSSNSEAADDVDGNREAVDGSLDAEFGAGGNGVFDGSNSSNGGDGRGDEAGGGGDTVDNANRQCSVEDSVVDSFRRSVEESGGAGSDTGKGVEILLKIADSGTGSAINEVGAEPGAGNANSDAGLVPETEDGDDVVDACGLCAEQLCGDDADNLGE